MSRIENSMQREWRPWVIIAGLVVVMIVNTVLFYLANKGFPGVVENDFYDKGVYYNEYMSRLAKQKARGWHLDVGWQGVPQQGQPSILRCVARDKAGQPISGAQVNVKLLRPGEPRIDQHLMMKEVAPGDYRLETILNRPGNWDMIMLLKKGEDTHEKQAEVWVTPS